MYDQIYKRIDDTLWKDAGCGSELDYVEQSSWILFLKYLDDLEQSRAAAAELDGRTYAPIIERKYRWSTWAVPKKNGEKDLSKTLDLPQKVFTAGVKTVVLFFEKGRPTKKTWFYQLNLDRTLGKTNPLTEDELAEFRTLFKKRADSANSWTVNIADLAPDTLDLTVRNPNAKEEKVMRAPREIAAEMAKLDKSNAALLADILKALG